MLTMLDWLSAEFFPISGQPKEPGKTWQLPLNDPHRALCKDGARHRLFYDLCIPTPGVLPSYTSVRNY